MSIAPTDPMKRKEFARLVRIILVGITVAFIAIVAFMIAGFSDADKRKFVYKSCANNLYLKERELNNARTKFESAGTRENEKLFRKAEEDYNEAVKLKTRALKAMKESGFDAEIRNIDNEVSQKYENH
jgi:hypothetical protein